MRKNLLKMCMVAIGLAMGTTRAWADTGDVTTNADIDFSNAISDDNTVAGSVGTMSIGQNSKCSTAITDGILYVGKGTHTVSIDETQRAGAKDVVTVSFEMAFGKLSKRYTGFSFQDADGASLGALSVNIYNGNFSSNDFGIALTDIDRSSSTASWSKKSTFTIVYDYAKKSITTTVTNAGANTTNTYTVAMSNTNPIAKFCVTSDYDNEGRRCQFDNLKITTTEGDYSGATKTVTIKYTTEDGSEIPSADIPDNTIFTDVVDANSEYTPTYPTSFQTDDNVYTYKSGGDMVTVTDDMTITLVYKKTARTKVDVVLNCVDGEGASIATRTLATSYPEGKQLYYGINKYIIKDGTLYEAEILTQGNYAGKTEASSTPISATYTEKTVDGTPVYFADFGDTPSTDESSTQYLRASGGQTLSNNSKVVLVPAGTLPAGRYTFEVRHFKNRAPKFNVGDTEYGTCTTGSNSGVMVTSTFSDVPVGNGEEISVTPGGSSYTDEMDYVLVTKVGELVETIAVSSAQYATYATNYNVVVPESGVKVYTVKVNDEGTAVEKTEVAAGTVIPAGTGILVSAEEGSYELSVTSDGAATIENNDLVAATSNVTSDGASYYALAQKDGKVGFALVATDVVIPAGKAYLKVENASGAKFISMDGELTAIEGIEPEQQNADGAYYTLQGVKMQKLAKGLYIHNGKKVVVK